jgi:polysaccharide export outer membrane protein
MNQIKSKLKETNMKKPTNLTQPQNFVAVKSRFAFRSLWPLALMMTGLLSGCESSFVSPDGPMNSNAVQPAVVASKPSDAAVAKPAEVIVLREGDVLKISFPASPTLDTTQQIRRDGKISLSLVGEVDATGLTPPVLEKKLVELYSPYISSRQITVEVVSSSFPVYVTGQVQHPGKILADHPLSALEAVMEAGGFDYSKANLRAVTVIRHEKEGMKNYKLDLKAVLDGRTSESFLLKPGDIVYVPERFTMF